MKLDYNGIIKRYTVLKNIMSEEHHNEFLKAFEKYKSNQHTQWELCRGNGGEDYDPALQSLSDALISSIKRSNTILLELNLILDRYKDK